MSPATTKSRRGFALILIIGLVAFLLILMIGIAAALRVESRLTANNQRWHEARQNALTGLNIALGRLQELAGPDARVTATADILNADPDNPTVIDGNRYWTGVWDSGSENFLGWLTSENALNQSIEDPKTSPNIATVPLVEAAAGDDSSDWIHLTPQPIQVSDYPGYPQGSEVTAGHFAWWIGDEGVKLSLCNNPRAELAYLDTEEEEERLALSTLQDIDLGEISSRLVSSDARDKLPYTRAMDQLLSISGIGEGFLHDHFHNSTWRSRGVLASTLPGGGLKTDLSQTTTKAFENLTIDQHLNDWINLRPRSIGNDKFGYRLTPPSILSTHNTPNLGISIIPTEFSLRFDLARSGNQLILVKLMELDIWNPYTFPMLPKSGGDQEIKVEIQGLPDMGIELINESTSDSLQLNKNLLQPEAVSAFDYLAAGQNKHLKGELETQDIFSSATSLGTSSSYRLSCPDSTISIRFLDADKQLLWEIADIPFEGFQSDELTLLTPSNKDRSSDMLFRIYFRLTEGPDEAMKSWLTQVDPRGPVLSASQLMDLALLDTSPDLYSGATASDFQSAKIDPFYGNKSESSKTYSCIRLFDLPSIPVTSIGMLRHLRINGQIPYSTLLAPDQLWDSAYLSGCDNSYDFSICSPASSHLNPFPNRHLEVLPSHEEVSWSNPHKAQQLLLDSAVNVNSVIPEVWENLLSTHLNRFPFEIEKQDTYNTPSGIASWTQYFRNNLSQLSDSEREDLAVAIVQVLHERGKPVFSISQLVKENLFQQAIDRTDINSAKIPYMAPEFLHQGDILNSLAPILQARSDTFKIRSYGDVVNPVTEQTEGRAWCEAIVQRVPEKLDGAADIQTEATGLGRKFKIINFRWLDVSEL